MKRRHMVLALLILTVAAPVSFAREIIVTSTADTGTGTLRAALQAARAGDVIAFDQASFPPGTPGVIRLRTGLPPLACGGLSIDACNAGVVLDGSGILARGVDGLYVNSDGNTIQGLQIIGFPANGITLDEGAQHNQIGGDRAIGSGPTGQGNVLSKNGERGIGLFGSGTSFNTISGNTIGTGPRGDEPWGNAWEGVSISHGVGNVIGPGNTIKSNSRSGVALDPGASNNYITRNAIADNSGPGISTERFLTPPSGIPAPTILEFDLPLGTVFGRACPGCTIEIYSDAADEGEIYEGSSTVDSAGLFSFSAESPLRGPHITATATAPEGGTSPFSKETEGPNRVLSLQEENPASMLMLKAPAPMPTAENHMGVDVGGWDWEDGRDNSDVYETLLQSIRKRGSVNWVRLGDSYCPLNWQQVLRTHGVYEIPSDCDTFITSLATMNVKIVVVLGVGGGLGGPQYPRSLDPNPGHGALGDVEPEWWFETQEQRDGFCEYVRFMAETLIGRVSHYEIWNEVESGENIGDPRGGVHLRNYILLLEQASSVIHEVDPNARVVAGAAGALYEEDVVWLESLLQSTSTLEIDAISWHPFYGHSPFLASSSGGGDPDPSYWEQYPSRVREIVNYALTLGFEGEYLAEEMIWRTPDDPNLFEANRYTDGIAAKYLSRAFVLHLLLDCCSMVSTQIPFPDFLIDALSCDAVRNLALLMAEHETIDLPVEVSTDCRPLAYGAFRYPDGDRILAIWIDGIAQEWDPGVPATISFPGLTAKSVTAIDALHGFEQQLVVEVGEGGAIVRDLLVKDYPIFIRLDEVVMGPDYSESVGDSYHRLDEAGTGGE